MLELLEYRSLIANLVAKDLKLRYSNSVLGALWSLLNPLLLLFVYTVAFKIVMRVQMENYPYFLLAGLLPWNFFSMAMLGSAWSIIGNADLVRKVPFPLEVLPIATVLFNLAQVALALAAFIPGAVLFLGVELHWTCGLVVPLLLLHTLFILGLALLLAALTTTFRDVAHLTEVGLQLLFWLTPVIYPLSMIPPAWRPLVELSPLASFAIAYQDVLFWGRVPEPSVLLVLALSTTASLAVGLLVFRARKCHFMEEL